MTRARIRKRFDLGRLRIATAGPGSDTRTWVATARIDDDPEAIRFEPPCGWIVDITFTSGDLVEEGPVPCRVSMSMGGEGAGVLQPPALGCEVLVLVTDGDPNANPVIVGYLDNGDGCGPPSIIGGFPVIEQTAQGTTYVASPGNLEAEYLGSARIQAVQGASITAPAIALAGGVSLGGPPAPPAPVLGPLGGAPTAEGLAAQAAAEAAAALPATEFPIFEVDDVGPLDSAPEQSYVRGDQFASDLDAFSGDLATFLTATGVVQAGWAVYLAGFAGLPDVPFLPLKTLALVLLPLVTQWGLDITAMNAGVTTFRATLVPGTMLSEKMRGD